MKKRKIKLLASLTSLVLVVAVMAVGVWAASSATVNITGNVSYTASGNIKSTITLKENNEASTITPTVSGGSDEANPVASEGQLVFNGSEEAGLTGTFTLGTAGTINLTATEGQIEDVTYSYTITIKNDYTVEDTASKKNLKVTVTEPTENPNISISYDKGDNTADWSDTDNTITIEPGKTVSYTVTFTTDPNTTASGNIGSSFALAIA